ncbi:PIN domain protein [Salix suchowensis]|nr:PIN domain protein [Salix suchowensis]
MDALRIMWSRQCSRHRRDVEGEREGAAFCEEKFGEWGYRDVIIKRFRTLVWPSAVMHLLRHSTLDRDEKPARNGVRPPPVGTPASLVQKYLGGPVSIQPTNAIADAFVNKGIVRPAVQQVDDTYPLGLKIVRTRQHVSTDEMLEYLVEFSPIQFVDLANLGIKGFRGAAQQTIARIYPELEEFRNRPTRANRRAPQATQARVAFEAHDEDMADTLSIKGSPPRRAIPHVDLPLRQRITLVDVPTRPQTPPRAQPKEFVFEGITFVDVNPVEVNTRKDNQPPSASAHHKMSTASSISRIPPSEPGGNQSMLHLPSRSLLQASVIKRSCPKVGLMISLSSRYPKEGPIKRAGQRWPRNTKRSVEPFEGPSETSTSQSISFPSTSQGPVSTRPTPTWRPSARVRAPVTQSPPGQPSCGIIPPSLRADPSPLPLPRAEFRRVARLPDALDVFLAQNPSPRDLGDVNNVGINSRKRPSPSSSQPGSTLKRVKSNQENRPRPCPRPIRPPAGAANRVVSAPVPLPKFKPPLGLFLRGMWDSDDDDMPPPAWSTYETFPLPRPSVGDQMPSSSQDSALYDGDIIDLTDY